MIERGGRPRRWLVALALGLAAVLVASCTQAGSAKVLTLAPVQGGTLTVGIDQAPAGCNPNASTQANWASRLVLQAVLPSTFSVDATGQSTGNLTLVDQAELISTTPQTVVYTIDKNAVWSDGRPITAADFEYAWEQQRGIDSLGLPTVQDASTLGYRDIKSIAASNRGKTVTVVFKQPYAQWQMLFDSLVPAHVMDKVGWNPSCPLLNPAVDLSGGPFEIHSVQHSEIVLTRNPKWWGAPALLSRVVIRVAANAAQLSSWLNARTAQVVLPQVATPQFVSDIVSNPAVDSDLDLSSTFLQLAFATQGLATSSVDVRQAIAHAIDRQSLVSEVTGWIDANVVPAQSHLYVQNQAAYPASPSTQNALNNFVGLNQASTTTTTTNPAPGSGSPFPTTADPATTIRLMLAAGYQEGVGGQWETAAGAPLVLRLVVDDGDQWAVDAGEQVADQLERAGFSVTTSTQPTRTATGMALASGAADFAVLPYEASPYPSRAVAEYTDSLGPPGQNGSQNWSNLEDPTVDSLLDSAEQQLNPVKAQPFYAQVDAALWTDMATLPLFAEPAVLGWSVQTYGVTPSFHGPNLLDTLATWQLRRPVAASSLPSSATTSP